MIHQQQQQQQQQQKQQHRWVWLTITRCVNWYGPESISFTFGGGLPQLFFLRLFPDWKLLGLEKLPVEDVAMNLEMGTNSCWKCIKMSWITNLGGFWACFYHLFYQLLVDSADQENFNSARFQVIPTVTVTTVCILFATGTSKKICFQLGLSSSFKHKGPLSSNKGRYSKNHQALILRWSGSLTLGSTVSE